jgi:signal transduction histidine kinase/ligand-binding sensor domain-containing protein
MLRNLWPILVLAWLYPATAWAVDPGRRISQQAHTAWRIQDGLFSSGPRTVVQTNDGYLWVGTDAGLLRFDGVRFVPWSPGNGQRLPSSQIYTLLAATDGSLWIATVAGLSRWKNQTLTNFPAGPGGVASILEDSKGSIWFGQANPPAGSGSLCQVVEEAIRCLGVADGFPAFDDPGVLLEDRAGSLWLASSTALLHWTSGSSTIYQPGGLKNNANIGGITGLASTPDGALWVGIAKAGPGLGLQRLTQGRWTSFTAPGFDGSALSVTVLHLDRQGALWVGTYDQGIFRIHGNSVERFDRTQGLSSDSIYGFGEDREGNLWIATAQGIDRFSDTPVIGFSAAEGICSAEVISVVASRDGSIWVGGAGALSNVRDGVVSCIREGNGLPGSQVTSLFEDHAGRLWVGIDNGVWVYDQRTFRKVEKPDGSPIGLVTGIAEDVEGTVWITSSGPPRILMRIQEFVVRQEYHEPRLPRRVAGDPTGGVWLGLLNGDLAHYHKGEATTYRFAHGDAAMVHQLIPDADGSVLAAASYGLIGRHDGKLMTLTAKNGLPCDELHAMTFDDRGHLWLLMECGLAEVTKGDLQMWRSNPDVTLSIRTLDVLDGVRTGRASFVAAGRSPDGRLWFANGVQLMMLDPARMRRNAVPPPVHVEQVFADRKSYPAAGVVHLPALTRDVEIDYVGLSFVAPQKVLFRYRLEGRDETWQEPGTRRQAFYSDLRPGTYRFRVIASNNDGLWNEQGAALDIVIAPAWYQTNAFLVLSILAAVVAVWGLYQLRIRQVARGLSARFDERLAERTRMARDLHDTLLQTVQGSKMVVDAALNRTDEAGMRPAMEQVSVWLGQASSEGRAAVQALRGSTVEKNDLAEAFHRAIEDCRRQGSLEASLSVTGDSRQMHPVVRDEVYRIGYEAIRNACTHSGGSRLAVELRYARDLIVRISDNGVGMDPAVASGGREGHFGLQGMRERAERIGAKLTVVSSASSGTEIAIIVPGRAIFHEPPASLFDRMRARLTN